MDHTITIMQGSWVANPATMTCRHLINKMVLHFTRDGASLKPEIKDMPEPLLFAIAAKEDSDTYLQKLVAEGEDVFLRAYCETLIEDSEIE
ncbi:hypothetical protein AGMMS50267_09220 [Spirochaetia bacterium]|nr:hypothetical protein AGMMS50267_09220 [Spirochaetia bacterium]